MNIFLDMDGVIADFSTSFQRISGVSLESSDQKTIRAVVDNSETIFRLAPLMPGAQDFVNSLLKLDPYLVFLTSVPHANFHSAYQQKKAWLKAHFHPLEDRLRPVISWCPKHYACKGYQDVLIDDYDVHTAGWTKAKGTAITYTPGQNDNIIQRLKNIKQLHESLAHDHPR